jgi:hypothetical protein
LQKRLVEPLELMKENAALISSLPMARVALQGALKAQESLGGPIERREHAAEMLP